jgi:hypothetical protein
MIGRAERRPGLRLSRASILVSRASILVSGAGLRVMGLAGLTGLLAVAGGIAGTSDAAAGTKITAQYRVTGSTYLKAVNTTMALGPGKLAAKVNLRTAKLSASLSLPDATASFQEIGLIPVTATTQFVQDGPTTGAINLNTGAVRTRSKITLQLVGLTIGGLGVPVGSNCASSSPATIALASTKGFSVVKGGKLAGTYTIPPFAGCGPLITPLLNSTIPGPGNTITLKLGAAKTG